MSRTSATLEARFLADLPTRLIGDGGYDGDPLDDTLIRTYGIEMIAANRRGRARTQDGRPLRRIRRRWKIERFFAWLHNSRRVVTRWERPPRELPRHGPARLCADPAAGVYEMTSR